MRCIILLALCLSLPSMAQNWALINPAYRYNYSDDGTDTISNQVRVMQVDTLGPDSMLFQLNGVALVCDTCGAWPGNNMFIWPNAPQWLGGSALIHNGEWHFAGSGSHVILPLATTGNTWLYDTLNNITAEMHGVVDTIIFDLADQVRSITLSNGDSLLLSRDHGVLLWPEGRTLIGINGLQVGRTIPTLEEFFPYGPGDVVEYETGHGYCDGIGGCESWTYRYKFSISDRVVSDSAIVFSGWRVAHDQWGHQTGGVFSPWEYVNSYSNSASGWYAGIPELPWTELLFSYPGQLVKRNYFTSGYGPDYCIAEHHLDSLGRYVIGCRSFNVNSWGEVGYFFRNPAGSVGPYGTFELAGPEDFDSGLTYREGLGLVSLVGNYFENYERYQLVGLVLDGDTVFGSITPDGIILSVNDRHLGTRLAITNDPSGNRITVAGLPPGAKNMKVLDATGQIQLSIDGNSSDSFNFDASGLASGMYILRLLPSAIQQRFIVVR